MPWIAVHSSINGPKLRKLRKQLNCSPREAKGLLVDLWLWGLENADREGYIIDADKEDIQEFDGEYYIEREYTPAEAVEALVKTGWIDEIEGKFFIHDWDVWQEYWYKAKDRREKDAERKRRSREIKEIEVPALSPDTPTAPNINKTKAEYIPPVENGGNAEALLQEKPKKKGKVEYPTGFEEFWKVYPRKVDKGMAYTKYKTRLNDGFSPEELMKAAQNYAAQCIRNRTEEKYIKHPRTFLGDSTPFVEFLPKETEKTADVEFDGNPFLKFGGDYDEGNE